MRRAMLVLSLVATLVFSAVPTMAQDRDDRSDRFEERFEDDGFFFEGDSFDFDDDSFDFDGNGFFDFDGSEFDQDAESGDIE